MTVDWRRAFMRMTAQYLNEVIHTELDIVDASDRDGYDDKSLKDDPIVIMVPIHKTNYTDMGNVHEAVNTVKDALEKNLSSLGIVGTMLKITLSEG